MSQMKPLQRSLDGIIGMEIVVLDPIICGKYTFQINFNIIGVKFLQEYI